MLDRAGRTELHHAATRNDSDAVESLIADGLDVNQPDEKRFTPLHFAAQQGSAAATSILLLNGADPNLLNYYGNGPLFVAVFNSRGRGDIISALLEAGADPDAANAAGQTPRGLAHLIANYDVAKFFERA